MWFWILPLLFSSDKKEEKEEITDEDASMFIATIIVIIAIFVVIGIVTIIWLNTFVFVPDAMLISINE